MLTSATSNDLLQFYIILGISLGVFFIIVLVCISIIVKRINKKHQIKSPKVKKTTAKEVEVKLFEIPHVYDLFGGRSNVVSYEQKGSRLVIELNDVDAINVEEIKEAGVEKILTMSKKVTLIGSGISNLFNNLQHF